MADVWPANVEVDGRVEGGVAVEEAPQRRHEGHGAGDGVDEGSRKHAGQGKEDGGVGRRKNGKPEGGRGEAEGAPAGVKLSQTQVVGGGWKKRGGGGGGR